MATIKMTPEEVRSLSKVYNISAEEIRDMLSKLQNTQGQLAQTWEGDAFQSFEEQFKAMEPTVRDFGKLLESVFNQLQKIAQIVETTDREISSAVRGGMEKNGF